MFSGSAIQWCWLLAPLGGQGGEVGVTAHDFCMIIAWLKHSSLPLPCAWWARIWHQQLVGAWAAHPSWTQMSLLTPTSVLGAVVGGLNIPPPGTPALAVINDVWPITFVSQSPDIAAEPEGEEDVQLGLETPSLSPGRGRDTSASCFGHGLRPLIWSWGSWFPTSDHRGYLRWPQCWPPLAAQKLEQMNPSCAHLQDQALVWRLRSVSLSGDPSLLKSWGMSLFSQWDRGTCHPPVSPGCVTPSSSSSLLALAWSLEPSPVCSRASLIEGRSMLPALP